MFDKYWGECNLFISIATILDPRNKMKMIELCFPQIYSNDDVAIHLKEVRDTLYKLYGKYFESYRLSNNEKQVESHKIASGSGLSTKGKLSGRAKFDSFIRTVNATKLEKSELNIYLEERIYICNEDDKVFDVLEWWRMNNLRFPILSKMACDVLSIPITIVTLETTFSAGGQVIDQCCSNLGTNSSNVAMC